MAIKINGKKVSVGVASKHVTLPLCGVYIAKTKANNAFTMYIDHWTCANKLHRGYHQVFINTKDHEHLFMRLCKAFKVSLPSSITQKAAAETLAAAMAEFGALKCVRVGKQHDWQDIHPVSIDGEALPWGHGSREGLVLTSLWNADEGDTENAESCYSISGKSLDDVVADIDRMGGMPTDTLSRALESVDVLGSDVDMDCFSKLSSLLLHAREKGEAVIRLKKKEESYV